MLDPNLLPVVRTIVAGIGGCLVLVFLLKFVQFWMQAKRMKRY